MSRFRRVLVSYDRYENDHLRYVCVKSPALKARGDITVFVPPGAGNAIDLPVVLLLHGVGGSHWCWTKCSGAHTTAQKLINAETIRPMVLAMPSDGLWGDGTGYIEHDGVNYKKWIMDVLRRSY